MDEEDEDIQFVFSAEIIRRGRMLGSANAFPHDQFAAVEEGWICPGKTVYVNSTRPLVSPPGQDLKHKIFEMRIGSDLDIWR